ncbi:hypothetical protein QF026_000195 [Streptomyces aurantiacus]|uniref:hypothetical protein n=1 Tax=Streptomyces aurantiacus TaxID=47760 RepID=UPI002791C75C|nr:hypothetical protein [Streptomyces aurantiacus]MDQ0771729.1 hypothetical protein [Streptomyces aurantiacus]
MRALCACHTCGLAAGGAPTFLAPAETAQNIAATVWQAGQDLMVPCAHGKWLAGHVPGAVTHLMKDEGYFSVALGRTAEVLRELVKTF